MTQNAAQITAKVYEEWRAQGRLLTVPPDALEDGSDDCFWSEVERRLRASDAGR